MTGRLAGKTCLVTAAGQGIGRATAARFVAEGASVVATDIDEAALAGVEGATARRLDVTDADAIVALFEAFPAFDVVFNCAGYVHQGSILDCGEEDWRASFDINVTSMFRVCKAALPGMLSNGGGSIVNMASVVSSVKGAPNRFAYGATKAAVIGLTRSIAVDFVGQGVRCNAICPGTVASPSLRARMAALPGDPAAVLQSFVGRQPLGRLGEPDEIAALALYLASDESAFATGAIHVIDGGWTT
ncbi:MAG TPA: SDR family oxidoreductase [Caulobacteraceae bacterium]|jgi:2-keto-3-deoxy-L-fuconate dehydrogenase|nr:SDR family oxidoreductase [Caulobacteraceae bacterium]